MDANAASVFAYASIDLALLIPKQLAMSITEIIIMVKVLLYSTQ